MSDFGPGGKFMLNRARATCAFCMWATCISLIQQRSGSREVSIMTELIEILREDHRNIETLLLVLERELNIFDRAEQPDYEVVQAIIDYFRDYPAATASVGDLEAEHLKGAKRLRLVARAVESVLSEQEVLRQTVDDIVRDFIEKERKHMEME